MPPGWRLVRSVLERPGVWLAACCALTAALCLGLPGLELRTDGAAIYPTGSPTIERTEADRRDFHEREQVIVLLTSRPGAPAFESVSGLRHLKGLHDSLSEVAGVQIGRLRSLASLLDPRPSIHLISTPRFLDEIPGDERDLASLIQRIDASPPARGLFLASSGKTAAFYVPVARGRSRSQLVADLEGWVEEHGTADFELRLSGPVTAEVTLGRTVLRDLARLVPLMVAVVAALLFLCLRSVAGVLVPMAEILMVLVWTLGAMGFCGVPVTLVTTVLPVLLMTVAVTDEIHLLERFREHLHRSGDRAKAAESRTLRRQAIECALGEVARPIVYTSLTTSIAFLSFLTAAMPPVRHFGLFTALGVLLAMLLSFTFVPALLLVLPAGWFREWNNRGNPRAPIARPASLVFHERLAARHGGAGVAIAVLLLVIAAPGLLRLSVQDSWVDNFDVDSGLLSAERVFNAELWGSYRFDVVLTAPEALYFHRPEGLRLVAELARLGEAGPHVGGVLSHLIAYQIVADVQEEGAPVWELPAERTWRIARLLYRVQRRIDLDQVLRSDGSQARLRIFVRSADYLRGRELQAYLERGLPSLLEGSGVRAHFSGDLPVAQAVVDAVVGNVLRSAGWTLAGVFLLLVVLSRSVRTAAVTITPLAAGIPIVLGFMGYAEVPLGIATSMFIAVTIGVAVDFAIHFSHAFSRHRRAGLGAERALEATLASAGRAIRWNTVILGIGLSVLALSGLKPNHSLGLLLAAAMATCYGTTLLLLPALLSRVARGTARSSGDRQVA